MNPITITETPPGRAVWWIEADGARISDNLQYVSKAKATEVMLRHLLSRPGRGFVNFKSKDSEFLDVVKVETRRLPRLKGLWWWVRRLFG